MQFVIFATAWRTGGPEALHQLAQMLQELGHGAGVLYGREQQGRLVASGCTTNQYPEYPDLRILAPDDWDPCSPSQRVVVLPEIWAHHALLFAQVHNVLVWWLSADHGLLSLGRMGADWDHFRSHPNIHHAYQSTYAAGMLRSLGLGRIDLPLSDYISASATDGSAPSARPEAAGRLAISFNPAKGDWLAETFRDRHPEVEWIAIQDMAAEEVRRSLARSHYYLDFGPLPGKDRLPREAIRAGCRVFLRRTGAGGHADDWRLPTHAYFSAEDCFTGALWTALQHDSRHGDPADWQEARCKVGAERDTFRGECQAMAAWLGRQGPLSMEQQLLAARLNATVSAGDGVTALIRDLDQAQQALAAMRSSSSWTLTAPLRRIVGRLRRSPASSLSDRD
ncbi:MAG: hypothetical protein VKN15_02465 [Cyanobacteriota bacterium]|nr:hypothetical protein [Cyanobacteriota bacterium]